MKNYSERALAAKESIAESLRRIADVMCAQHEEYEEAKAWNARQVNPAECDHPREHRYDNSDGAILRRGCHLCGVEDITKARRSA